MAYTSRPGFMTPIPLQTFCKQWGPKSSWTSSPAALEPYQPLVQVRPRVSSCNGTNLLDVSPLCSLNPSSRKCTLKSSVQQCQHISPTPFEWFNQWYPLALEVDLDPSVPTPAKVHGQRLVIWRAKFPHPSWAVFHDACPHRKAALSEGRINPATGQLECGYHGWQFSAVGGACTFIPQASDQSVTSSPRACATQLPSMLTGGVLFVWLGGSTRPPRADELPAVVADDEELSSRRLRVVSAITRDLPFSFTTLLQNVLDPAHIHFAHHGQLGRREHAGPIDVWATSDVEGAAFLGHYHGGQIRVRFLPPCLVEIVTMRRERYAYYAVPTGRFASRTIGLKFVVSSPLDLIARWLTPPRWLDHMRRNALVDGDLTLLHSQECMIAEAEPFCSDVEGTYSVNAQNRPAGSHPRWVIAEGTSKTPVAETQWPFFTPTSSDRLVVELRRWLAANPLQSPKPEIDRALFLQHVTRRELLDRHKSHVLHCSTCRGAFRNIRTVKKIARVARAFAIGTAVVLLGISSVGPGKIDGSLRWRADLVRTNTVILTALEVLFYLARRFHSWCGMKSLLSVYCTCLVVSLVCSRFESALVYTETARKHTHGP